MILINAVSARYGGARQILLSALKAYGGSSECIVLCPKGVDLPEGKNLKYIGVDLSGPLAFLFNSFFINIFIIFFSPSTYVSFNNVQPLFLVRKLSVIVYFHQLKILTGSSLRFLLMRGLIKMGVACHFYVQTPYVKNKFQCVFGDLNPVSVAWPGVDELSVLYCAELGRLLLWPSGHIRSGHKNFQLLLDLREMLHEHFDHVAVPTDEKIDGFFSVGSMSKSNFLDFYTKCVALIVTSTEETLCLPIFEFLQTGRPIFLLRSDYTEGIFHIFDKIPSNVFFFENSSDLELAILQSKLQPVCKLDLPPNYNVGDWVFLWERRL